MKWLVSTIKDRIAVNEVLQLNQYDLPLDIISIDEVKVSGDLNPKGNTITLTANVKAKITMACAFTLKPVLVDLDFDFNCIYGNSNDSDYPLNQEIDIRDAIFGAIISEKPYRVFHKDADKKSFENNGSKPLSGLKDYLDK